MMQNQNIRLYLSASLKLLVSITLAAIFSGCVTTKIVEKKTKEEDVLAAQKTLIYNYLNTSNPDKAYYEVMNLIKKYPDDVDLLNFLGLSHLARNNPVPAIKAFKKAFKRKQTVPIALNLSSALISIRKNKSARRILQAILKDNQKMLDYPYPERVYHNLALTYESSKKYNLAEKYFHKALEKNPSYYMSLMRLGFMYKTIKQNHKAMKTFRLALNQCYSCYEPMEALTNSYLALGSNAMALKTVSEYLNNSKLNSKDRSRAQLYLNKINSLASRPLRKQRHDPLRSLNTNRL